MNTSRQYDTIWRNYDHLRAAICRARGLSPKAERACTRLLTSVHADFHECDDLQSRYAVISSAWVALASIRREAFETVEVEQ